MTKREYDSLPRELASGLRSLDLRVRALAALRGAGVLCAVVGTALALALLIDWLVDVGVTARTGLLLGVIGAAVVTFAAAVIGPLLRRTSASELAALVDDAHPELGERIESAVELSDPNIPERDRGSLLMRSRLLEESVRRSARVNFGASANSSSAVRWVGIGAITLVLLLTPFGLSRDGYGLLLTRFLNPWRNLERATNLYFFIEQGDRTVARGSDVTIVAEPRWRIVKTSPPDHAWLHWQSGESDGDGDGNGNGNGESDVRRMEFDADSGTFRATIPHVLTSFDYEVSAGRVQTRTYEIDVVAAPAIEQFTLEIAPPAYTGLPARRLDSPVGRIEVFEQSRLSFHLEFSKPVVSAALTWVNAAPNTADPAAADSDTAGLDTANRDAADRADAEPASPEQAATSLPHNALAATLADDGRSGMLTVTADRAGPFRIELRDQRGVGNLDDEPWELLIVADQPPAIEWADAGEGLPRQDATIAARPQDKLPLPVIATDDVGVAELELHAEVVQRSEPLEPFVADATWFGRTTVNHTFSWDLSQLPLQEGDLLAVRARAVDGRPSPGPQEAWTESRLIRITSDAESIEKSLLAEKQRRLRGILEAVRENVQEDRQTTETLRESAREATDEQQPSAPQEEIAQLAEREQKLTARLDQLAAVFAEHPLRRNMAEQTRDVGTGPLSEAGEQFQQAASAPPAERLEPLTNAADELARAEEQLDQLLGQFDELAALEQDLLRLQKLAEDAEQLAENVADFEQQQQQLADAKELAEEQRQVREDALAQQQKKLQTNQQNLTDDLDRLLEDRPEVLDAATERQRERLQELSEQASQLADREDRLAAALEQEPQPQEGQPQESPESPAEPEPSADDDTPPLPTDRPAAPPEDDITQQQQQLAEDAARLALETARNRGVESPSARQAREFAENSLRAAEEAQTGLLGDAAQSAENATAAARQAAEQLQDPTDPAPAPLQEQAAALAEQQASLAEQLRQQSESPAARQQAQADGQRQLAEQTDGLSDQLQEIAERLEAEPLNNAEESGLADAARRSAEEASAAMQSAQQELEQGQSGDASPKARAAAEALRQTARQAGETAEASETDESSPVPGEVGEQVVDARRQLQQAGERLRQNEQSQASNESADGNPNSEEQSASNDAEPSTEPADSEQASDQPSDDSSGDPSKANDAQTTENADASTQPQPNGDPQDPSSETDASQSLQQVAQSLRDAAQQLGMSPPPSDRKGKPGEQPGEPSAGDPGSESGDAGSNPISLVELEAELKRMSRRDWGKLPGRVESELFQSAQKKPAGDYARLIHLYFEEISRRRTATESLTPNDNDL